MSKKKFEALSHWTDEELAAYCAESIDPEAQAELERRAFYPPNKVPPQLIAELRRRGAASLLEALSDDELIAEVNRRFPGLSWAWTDEGIGEVLSYYGYEPCEMNVLLIKAHRDTSTIEERMAEAGREVISDVIRHVANMGLLEAKAEA